LVYLLGKIQSTFAHTTKTDKQASKQTKINIPKLAPTNPFFLPTKENSIHLTHNNNNNNKNIQANKHAKPKTSTYKSLLLLLLLLTYLEKFKPPCIHNQQHTRNPKRKKKKHKTQNKQNPKQVVTNSFFLPT
jgi:hypothetical protein